MGIRSFLHKCQATSHVSASFLRFFGHFLTAKARSETFGFRWLTRLTIVTAASRGLVDCQQSDCKKDNLDVRVALFGIDKVCHLEIES